MHQHPRPAPRSAASANSQQTNPLRTNNQRETMPSLTPSNQDLTTEADRPAPRLPQVSNDDKTRMNPVVQRFFFKGALTILSSRVSFNPVIMKNGDVKMDRWFNTLIEDTEELNQELHQWKSLDCLKERPSPLIIEVYLDMNQVAHNKSLIAVDEEGKAWDVGEALQDMAATSGSRQAPTKLVYERWTISLDDDTGSTTPSTIADTAPSLYKKGVVAMRSLYTYTKYLPAWRFGRRLAGAQAGNAAMATLRPSYNIVDPSSAPPPELDTLTFPIFPSEESSAVETFVFAPLNSVFGSLNIAVTYRKNCDFKIELTEKLLSTKDMRSSREVRKATQPLQGQQSVNSTVTDNRRFSQDERLVQARPGEAGTPPKPVFGSYPARPASEVPVARRPSVSFDPFKAGSLSSSPGAGAGFAGSPSSSLGRSGTNLLNRHARNPSSLNTLPQQALRTPQLANEAAVTSSGSSSPKPAPLQRYSSSFGNRKSRFPSSGNIRNEEDNLSSGRGSVSSTNRGSGSFPEAEASSTSANADDDNIADFLKMLDKNKGLQSFTKTDQVASSQRTAAQYSKFARMRDSTTQLSESMSSSLMLQRSSSSSSRQLHNVPGMIAGSSLSTSSSPGKPISPHTPHLPAIPSRLSNNSITADYSRDASRTRPAFPRAPGSGDGSLRARSPPRSHGTPASTAIDIPTSPRTFPTGRRSSSAAQQARIRPQIDEAEVLPYGHRSASMPNDQAGELNLSESLDQTESGSVTRRRRDGSGVAAVDDDDEPLLFALAE